MSQSDFVRLTELLLQVGGVPFEQRDLIDFVAGHWPRILEDPAPVTWAEAFLASRALAVAS